LLAALASFFSAAWASAFACFSFSYNSKADGPSPDWKLASELNKASYALARAGFLAFLAKVAALPFNLLAFKNYR